MRDWVWWLAFGAETGGKPRGARPCCGVVGAQRRLLPQSLAGEGELFRGEGSALFLKTGSRGS